MPPLACVFKWNIVGCLCFYSAPTKINQTMVYGDTSGHCSAGFSFRIASMGAPRTHMRKAMWKSFSPIQWSTDFVFISSLNMCAPLLETMVYNYMQWKSHKWSLCLKEFEIILLWACGEWMYKSVLYDWFSCFLPSEAGLKVWVSISKGKVGSLWCHRCNAQNNWHCFSGMRSLESRKMQHPSMFWIFRSPRPKKQLCSNHTLALKNQSASCLCTNGQLGRNKHRI